MKSYTILVLLLSLFVHDALAAATDQQQKKGLFVDDALATKTGGKANKTDENNAPVNLSLQSPRVYKSGKQFGDEIGDVDSWHVDSMKACFVTRERLTTSRRGARPSQF